MPARWTFGYMQSQRTLDGPDEILGVAKTFREKKLPCDALIYLGTEFAPSGWNTRNGEFTWHPTNFPDPKKMIDELHADHFKVIVHIVIEGRRFTGTVNDPCTAPPAAARPHAGRPVAAGSAGRRATGRRTSRSWTSASTAGGPIRATASTVRRGSTVIGCTGKARSSIARTSGRSRCTATRRPACSDSAASSGRATCSRAGRR